MSDNNYYIFHYNHQLIDTPCGHKKSRLCRGPEALPPRKPKSPLNHKPATSCGKTHGLPSANPKRNMADTINKYKIAILRYVSKIFRVCM